MSMPSCANAATTERDSSSVNPPRWKSAELSLIPTAKPGDTRTRIRRTTSSTKRIRRSGETLDDVFDLSRCQLTRRGRTGKTEGDWARRHRGVTECQRVGLAPWMIELHPDR